MSQTPFFFTPAQQFSIISKPSWSSLFVTSSSNTYIFKPQQPNMTHCHGTMMSPVSTLIHGPFKALLNSDWSETAGLRKFEFDYLKKKLQFTCCYLHILLEGVFFPSSHVELKLSSQLPACVSGWFTFRSDTTDELPGTIGKRLNNVLDFTKVLKALLYFASNNESERNNWMIFF